VLLKRVNARSGHFIPHALLDSQFAALESLEDDELGSHIDISRPFAAVVGQTELYVGETLG
jgi:gluconokinase